MAGLASRGRDVHAVGRAARRRGGGMIRVLVADDETMLRGALTTLLELEDDLTIVAEAETTTAAVSGAAARHPHIAVLDLAMPPADGVVVDHVIQRDHPDVMVLLVIPHARPAVLRRGLSAGVRAIVSKSTPAQWHAHIIRDVHAGRRYVV